MQNRLAVTPLFTGSSSVASAAHFHMLDKVDKKHTLGIIHDIVAVVTKPHIIITSRIQDLSDSFACIKLEVFSSGEALDYISAKLSGQNESLTDKMVLADILKNLPLVLRQQRPTLNVIENGTENTKFAAALPISQNIERRY